MTQPNDYVPLWCKSNFSFLEGASHPAELVQRAYELGFRKIAITDRDGVYGIVRAHAHIKELQRENEDVDLEMIYGSQISVLTESNIANLDFKKLKPEKIDDMPICTVQLLCMNRQGYKSLCQLISVGRLRCPKGKCRVTWREVLEHHEDLILMWDAGSLCKLEEGVDEVIKVLKEHFSDRFYLSLSRHQLEEEPENEMRIIKLAKQFDVPIVAANEVLYHVPTRRRLQDVMTCIRHKTKLDDAGSLLQKNHHYDLKSKDDFVDLFSDHPDWVERTHEISKRCVFSLSTLKYVYPTERLPDGTTSSEWLKHLTYAGARTRYGGSIPDAAKRQLDDELETIETLDYAGYFLTMYEIVKYCRENKILCQGRGSAANSVVCYTLGVTAIDPIKMELLFERFISRERAEPPDIDLDISHERREEVIQHVYQKHGRTHAAMVANFIRYRSKSSVRDIGKVLGLSETFLDKIAKLLSPYNATTPGPQELEAAGVDSKALTQRVRLMLDLVQQIADFPRHLSIHPGGFILGHEAINHLVPVENATMKDRTVIQWDKYDVEDMALFKVDLLGLGALTQLDKGFKLISKHRNLSLCMATLPPGDSQTYDMIERAETVGVFQIESRAQMSMLPRLKPRTFYDLVIEVGIVRPGPISGDMVHPYLRRRDGVEDITYAHPCLEPVLKKTLGIPLFQEQVMKLAVVAADYTPGEADQLRRDMAAWKSTGRIERHRERLITRMKKKGIEEEFAIRVFDQICGFGEYGFPESHAASFALITYATCFMKCHYPVEFACSLLNSQPMGFYSPATIIDEAKRNKVRFFPIDIEQSEWDCTMEGYGSGSVGFDKFGVRMGLSFVKGLRADEGKRIVAQRKIQHFESIRDFVIRTRLSSSSLCTLAECGAFECFGVSRRDALWQVQGLGHGTLALPFELENADVSFKELLKLESIKWDYETSFHSSRGHPLESIREDLVNLELPSALELTQKKNGSYVHYAGMVICRQRPQTAAGVIFMTLEDETGFANLIIWPSVYEENRIAIKSIAFLGVSGRLQNKHNVTHLVVDKLWHPKVHLRIPDAKARNFH